MHGRRKRIGFADDNRGGEDFLIANACELLQAGESERIRPSILLIELNKAGLVRAPPLSGPEV
jgi:hypothetical protein